MRKLQTALLRVQEEEAYISRNAPIPSVRGATTPLGKSGLPSGRVSKFFDRKTDSMQEWVDLLNGIKDTWKSAHVQDPNNRVDFETSWHNVWIKGGTKFCTIKNGLGRIDISDTMWSHVKIDYWKGKLESVKIFLINGLEVTLDERD